MIQKTHVSLRIIAIGDNTPVFNPTNERLNFRMIKAHDTEAIEGHILYKLTKCGPNIFKTTIVIKMLGIDVGNHRNISRQFQESAVAFVSLYNHPVTFAHTSIGAIGIDNAAIDYSRIQMPSIQQCRDHRGGGGFAMRATNGNGMTKTH